MLNKIKLVISHTKDGINDIDSARYNNEPCVVWVRINIIIRLSTSASVLIPEARAGFWSAMMSEVMTFNIICKQKM